MITKFLLVDDDEEDAELFQEALRNASPNAEFVSYTDCRQVFSKLRAGELKPEIIFLDINMPHLNGWDCLSIIQNDERLRTIPVIIYSTSSVTIDGRKALHNGATGFLEKPPSYIKLKEFLEKIVTTPAPDLRHALHKIEASKTHGLLAAH